MSTLRADTCASASGPPTWSRTYPRTLLVVVCAHTPGGGANVMHATKAAIANRDQRRSAFDAILLMSALLYAHCCPGHFKTPASAYRHSTRGRQMSRSAERGRLLVPERFDPRERGRAPGRAERGGA